MTDSDAFDHEEEPLLLTDDLLPDDGQAVADPDDIGDAIGKAASPVPVNRFLFIGRGLTPGEFTDYVNEFDFSPNPASYVVLHHTAAPTLEQWNGAATLSPKERVTRRLDRMINMRETYRTNPKYLWDRGPHLFIDDERIWLFTPMSESGIHASAGNGWDWQAQWAVPGYKHFGIGIEVVGDYTNGRWPEPVAELVGFAVATIRKRLLTFNIEYKRGPNSHLTNVARNHDPMIHSKSICSHRDFNKPSCPGIAIDEQYYIQVCLAGWDRVNRQ